MTKRDLIEKVYLKTDVSKKDVSTVINSVMENILESVYQGDRVELRGFGTFYLAEKKQRQVFSPIAQKKVDVKGGFNVMFKSSKSTQITNQSGD